MLIGAGSAGQMIFRDIKHAKETNEKVYCFIDEKKNTGKRKIFTGVRYVQKKKKKLDKAC